MLDKTALSEVKGIGESYLAKFDKLGIYSVGELISYFPKRYDDYSNITPIVDIKPGTVSIKGEIKQAKGRYVRRGMHITEAVVSDPSGSVRLVWFNQPYREKSLKPGTEYYVSGKFEFSYRRLAIMNPSVELVSDFPISTGRILPIYRETKGLSSRQIRRYIRDLLPNIKKLKEPYPRWITRERQLESRSWSMEKIHFPDSNEELEQAKKRLGFDELFMISLASLLNKNEIATEKAIQIKFNKNLAKEFVQSLSFKLTDDQRRVVWRIYQDFQKSVPMNLLVEGDVGSGKTVVAVMAALMAIKQGYQAAFMAPTTLLATQHAENIYKLLEPLGLNESVGLLTGGMNQAAKSKARNAIASGQMKLIVGTHTLIQEKIDMHKLGLTIIDEQHRFGVDQRRALVSKAGHMPHVLSLTATPIPRSLALVLYGELDIAILKSKPVNRKPVITKIYPENSRSQVYRAIDGLLDDGHQVFVVCPLISESTLTKAKSAEEIYKFLKIRFKDRSIGLLHGKLQVKEKDRILKAFLNKKLEILVSTTVVEVGIDIPNANVMLVESAEQFGLAQIHQLRGRVGRNDQQAFCFLMVDGPPSRRLKMLETINDGFKLAELDLEIRGPGALYGTLQHGELDLRFAKLSDHKLIAEARESAEKFIELKENLVKYKELSKKVNKLRAMTGLN